MKLASLSLILATLSTGIMAGIFYAWTCSVTNGIGRLSDLGFLQAFQAMNRAILNPAFYLVFIGSSVLLPIVVFIYMKAGGSPKLPYLVGAAVIYLSGSIALTFFGNVPLNNLLEVLQLETMSAEALKTFRISFEGKWNNYNMIRTISSAITLLLLIVACTIDG